MTNRIRLTVNGTAREVEVPAYRTLLDCLRYDLGLTGSKEGCGVGVCGACTVLLDGKMVSSCIALAVFADGHEVTTVEGITGSVVPAATSGTRPTSPMSVPNDLTLRSARVRSAQAEAPSGPPTP